MHVNQGSTAHNIRKLTSIQLHIVCSRNSPYSKLLTSWSSTPSVTKKGPRSVQWEIYDINFYIDKNKNSTLLYTRTGNQASSLEKKYQNEHTLHICKKSQNS
ncbi:hypothetical protein Droror1_Dr00005834 [Drosera rotundifolia]